MAKGTKLTLENLRLLDLGKATAAFNAEVQYVVQDCIDRAGLVRPREVILKLHFVPEVDKNASFADCAGVAVQLQVGSKIPSRKSRVFTMKPHKDGSLEFNPDLPDDPEERTVFDDMERAEDQQGKDGDS